MDDNKAENEPLVEVEIEGRPTPEDDRGSDEDVDHVPSWWNILMEIPSKWVCCAFRVRIVGLIALLLLQIPMIGYYYSSSDLYMKFPTSYRDKLLSGVFSNNQRMLEKSLSNFPNSVFSIVTRNHSSFGNESTKSLPSTTDKAITTYKSTTLTDAVTTNSSTSVAVVQTEAVIEADSSILPKCPPDPPGLQGRLPISFDKPPNTFEQTELDNPLLTIGGHSKPPLCVARHKVAIIIPFRDREEHLRYFLQFMHPILQRQQVDYQIFIVNQMGKGKFNRAKLMNIGFLESLKIYPFECFSFHDVDLVVEDDRSLYWCSDRPRHMSAGVDKFNYVLPYNSIFGGVTLLTKEHMEQINGFSNEFWGWGGEDDDVFNRLKIVGYQIVRYPMEIARYKMIRHQRDEGNEPNPRRFELIRRTRDHYKTDGLSSIKYKVHSIDFNPTYTNITVDVMGPAR